MSINNERITKTQQRHNGLCCTIIENIGVTLGKTIVLKDINLHIHCEELTVIIGPNGAGKSTLLKAIFGEFSHNGTLSFLDEKAYFNFPITTLSIAL